MGEATVDHALIIAGRVYAPGLIEDALSGHGTWSKKDAAAAVRKALTASLGESSAGPDVKIEPGQFYRMRPGETLQQAANRAAREAEVDAIAEPAEKWEYKIAPLPLHPNNFNELGAEGWELVCEAHDRRPPSMGHNGPGMPIFIFKRRVSC